MITQYRELFYNYNSNSKRCKSCHYHSDTCIQHHIINKCNALDNYRHLFWNHTRFKLSQIASKINTIHQQTFVQYIMKILENSPHNRHQLWKLVCGANRYNLKSQKLEYNNDSFAITQSKYKFYNYLISQIHLWIHNVYNLQYSKKPPKLSYYEQQHAKVPRNSIIYHIRCDSIEEWEYHAPKLKPNDIIIATDSSHNNGYTGIGVFIQFKRNLYTYYEPLGKVTNNYGELYAINKSYTLLNHLNIDIKNNRSIIMTDSLLHYINLLTTPKNVDKLPYKSLFKQTKINIKSMNTILWKIKSHTTPPQYNNNIADLLADEGRKANNSIHIQSPDNSIIMNQHIVHTVVPDSFAICNLHRKSNLRVRSGDASFVFERG